jgi:hypothetical protein
LLINEDTDNYPVLNLKNKCSWRIYLASEWFIDGIKGASGYKDVFDSFPFSLISLVVKTEKRYRINID